MSRSSIFSFETLRFSQCRPVGVARAVVLALLLLAAAEGLSRWGLASVGRHWEYWHPEAGAKFECYRQLSEAAQSPEIVVVGDSTAHANFNPHVLVEELGKDTSVWNLGWPGNFALAFEKTTMPMLRASRPSPRVVVASFLPTGFADDGQARDSEASILGCAYCRRQDTGWLFADYVHLARVWPSLPTLKMQSTGKDLDHVRHMRGFGLKEGNFLPVDRERTIAKAATNKEPNTASMAVPVTIDRKRLAALEALAKLCRQRGTKLIVVVPPSLDFAARRLQINKQYRAVLADTVKTWGFTVIDVDTALTLAPEDFSDQSHLNVHGARRLSEKLAEIITADGLF